MAAGGRGFALVDPGLEKKLVSTARLFSSCCSALLLFAEIMAQPLRRVKSQGASAASKDCLVSPSKLHRFD